MVGRNTLVLVCVLDVLLCVSNTVAAFKCYKCEGRSDSSDSCSDKFTKRSNLESAATCLGCSKSKQNGAIIRACSPIPLSNTCEKSGGNVSCSCDSELCNGSTTLAVSIATLLRAALVVVFFPSSNVLK